MADNQEDVDTVLTNLLAGTRQASVSRAATTAPTAPDRSQEMLSIFQQAFPDQEFTLVGPAHVRGVQKKTVPQAVVPPGYQPNVADVGIRELQTALTNAESDEERFSIATRLNTLVQTQKMYKFDEYRRSAESLYAVPDIISAIDSIKQAELSSPYNPGGGIPSQERMQLMTQLGTARSHAAARVKELMATDPVYAQAEALALGTVAEIGGRLKIAGRTEILDKKRADKEARDYAISTMNPDFVINVGILKNGRAPKSPEEHEALAARMLDGKIKLSPLEQGLVQSNDATLAGLYTEYTDPKDKTIVSNMIQARELAVLGGDEKQAELNTRIFKAVMDKDLSNPNDVKIPKTIRNDWQKIKQNELMAPKNKESQLEIHNAKMAVRRKLLTRTVEEAHFSNVENWKGFVQSDTTAKAILSAAPKDKPLNVDTFIDKYLEFNDGSDLATKSKSLQAIIVSGIEALPRSVVLPIPSPQSAQQKALMLVASRTVHSRLGGYSVNILEPQNADIDRLFH